MSDGSGSGFSDASSSSSSSSPYNSCSYYSLADRPTALVFMITAFVSTICSYVTIRECIADCYCCNGGGDNNNNNNNNSRRRLTRTTAATSPRRRNNHQRQLQQKAIPLHILSMNVAYFIYGLAKCFGPIPGPAHLQEDCENVWGTYGTTATCTAQGFFIQLSLWSLAFHLVPLVSLYVAIVQFDWKEPRLKRAVTYNACAVWTVCSVMAVIGLPYEVFNFKDQNCYIAVYPAGCLQQQDDDNNCIRGGHAAYVYGWIVKAPYFPIVITMIILFFIVFRKVRWVEDRMSRYASGTTIAFTTVVQQVPEASSSSVMAAAPVSSSLADRQQQHAPHIGGGVGNIDDDERGGGGSGRIIRPPQPPQLRTGVNVNREKSRAVAIQGTMFAGYYFALVCFVMFEMFSPLILGYKDYWLHMVKTVADNSQALVFFVIFARPRQDAMMTKEGRFLRNVLFCVGIRQNQCATTVRRRMNQQSVSPNVSSSGGGGYSHGAAAANSNRSSAINETALEERGSSTMETSIEEITTARQTDDPENFVPARESVVP